MSQKKTDCQFVPTIPYTVHKNTARTQARKMAGEVAALIRKREIDPANFVLMFGEEHDQVSQGFFQMWTVDALKKECPGICACYEWPENGKSFYEPVVPVPEYKLAKYVAFQKESQIEASLPLYGGALYDYPVHYIDIDRDGKSEKMTSTFPANFAESYGHLPVVAKILEHYPKITTDRVLQKSRWRRLFDSKNHIFSEATLLKRELFMMDKIVTIQKKTKAPLVTINGRMHLVDPLYSSRTTLTEMLLANGKDIITVQQGGIGNGVAKMFRDFQFVQQVERLPPQDLARYHANIDAQTEDCKGYNAANIKAILDVRQNRQLHV